MTDPFDHLPNSSIDTATNYATSQYRGDVYWKRQRNGVPRDPEEQIRRLRQRVATLEETVDGLLRDHKGLDASTRAKLHRERQGMGTTVSTPEVSNS
ncbi:hypothetical protein [Halarchaeum salinum]|uniref:Uncharacterized protein n=1 Tax=Halarchaeum salinum TaxID=489912 RepID=A0AAV3S999_9EURY